MSETEQVKNALLDAMLAPKSTSVDGLQVTERSLSELIALHKHLANVGAQDRNHSGLRFRRLEPPGAG